MTAPLVERVALAAFEAFGGAEVASGKPWEQQSETLRNAFRDEARAAIAEVFDWLVEPSEDVIASGIEQIEKCTFDWTASAACAPGHTWQTMLRQMRKEALGEEP
jgi:hypothetical protein